MRDEKEDIMKGSRTKEGTESHKNKAEREREDWKCGRKRMKHEKKFN